MKFKTKILILLFILILSINTICFASSTETKNVINYQGYEFPEFPSDYDNYNYHYIMYVPNSNSYVLSMTNSIVYYSSDHEFSHKTNTMVDEPGFVYYYATSGSIVDYKFNPKNDNSSWSYIRTFGNSSGFILRDWTANNNCIVFSDFNITNDDDDSTFFYKTPFLHFTNTQLNFAKSFFQPLSRVLAVIIPVGVVIMAILVTVSLIAYFKFWRT